MKKQVFLTELKDLQMNTTLSSSQIFVNLLDLFIKFSRTKNDAKIFDENLIRESIDILEHFHPEMAIMDIFKEKIFTLKRPWNNEDLSMIVSTIKQEISRSETIVTQKATKIIKDNKITRLLTISYSMLTFHTINALYKEKCIHSCTICDSGPKFEGLVLAKDIRRVCPNLNLNIISDAMAPSWILNNRVDAAIFGADTVYADNSVLNKSGSLGIGLSCAFKKMDCYVIAISLKKRKTLFQQEQLVNQNPADYSWYNKNGFMQDVKYWNYYFDYLPKDLIKLIIDDTFDSLKKD